MPSTSRSRREESRVRLRALLAGAPILLMLAACGCDVRQGADGLPGVSNSGVKGSGVLKTEQRPATAYSRIEVSSIVKLDWQAKEQRSLEVMIEDNLLPLLATETVGDTLKIHFKENVNPTKEIVVKAAGPSLDALAGSGAVACTLNGVKSDHFELKLSGTSQCTISGSAKALSVDCQGASGFKGEGLEAGTATVATSGTSQAQFHAAGLESIEASGASHVTVDQVNTPRLKVSVSGTSECTVSGSVERLTIEASGASAVHGDELKAQSVQVDVGGTSQVEVEAIKSIAGSASGASSVHYRGKPTTHAVQTSGTASVQRK